jgi:phospholipid/cholesterol/gamma-HCH transport system substrate-binding protein
VQLRTEIERKLTGRMALASRAFLWLAAAGIAGALLAFAYAHRWLTPTLDLYFYTHTATGLNRGMAVKLVGFNVGSLDEVSIVGELRVKGKVVIDRKYRDAVGKDSRIRLTKEYLLGAYILELIPGPGDPGPVDNGSTLDYERELDYNAMVANLIDRVGPVIDDLRRVTSQLGDPQAGVQKTMRHLGEAADSFVETSRGWGRFAADGSRLTADVSRMTRDVPARMDPVLNDLRRSLAQLESLAKQLNEALPPMIEDTHKSLQSARAASESAQRLMAEDVPRVLRRGETVLEGTDEIVGGVRRSWPVRNMLPRAEEKLIELDSADGAGHAPAGRPAP